jgi:hypothetical protein
MLSKEGGWFCHIGRSITETIWSSRVLKLPTFSVINLHKVVTVAEMLAIY